MNNAFQMKWFIKEKFLKYCSENFELLLFVGIYRGKTT